ncbi:MAG: Rdx family protein [Nitrososphaerota archaeon]|jgi:selT/selW/selH-like putative selenoprotein|nr:Rdx family protein [Nitrososphaerota archaeon]MDG6917981.1 Rdx family protein [Nitrososphaerota archaeon]
MSNNTVKYEMQFCVGCYLGDALALAKSLLETNPHDESLSLTLVPGEAGSFEVKMNDQVVYSKKSTGRLPTAQDIGLGSWNSSIPSAQQASGSQCC